MTRPDLLPYSSIAQSVEHATVNRRVVGSSPTWGAKRVRLAAAALRRQAVSLFDTRW